MAIGKRVRDQRGDLPDRHTFTARYESRCDECGEPICPGDEVRYDDDDVLVHEECG